MEYRKLGKSGLKLSALSFGSWVTFQNQLDISKAKELMNYAYENGVNFFDNAEVYANGESEKIMGAAIKDLKWKRDTFALSSKVFWGGDKPTQIGLSRKHIFDCCHNALKRMQVDYLDLYFCHRPDPDTPIEEIVWAMNDLMRQGKIMYWGTSEWNANDILDAHKVAKALNLIPPTMEQPEYNLFHRENMEGALSYLCNEMGMGTTIWSPLASGLLTGKYNNGIPQGSRATVEGYEWIKRKIESPEGKERIEKVKKLEAIAKELNCSTSQLAIAWCLKNPNVSTVILGATKLNQLMENLKSLEIYKKLSDKNMKNIELIF